MKKINCIFYFQFLIVLIFLQFFTACSQHKKPKNVLFISIDALRADHLGCYGYKRNTSPNIDQFAKENIQFNNFFTVVPKTGPSLTSFFTGLYMQHHGVVTNAYRRNPSVPVLAELLPKKLRKAAFVSNPSASGERGYSDGFDEFNDIKGGQQGMTEKVLEWLDYNKDGDGFFLWVHYLDPHGPYKPPQEFNEIFVGDEFYDTSRKVELDYVPQNRRNKEYVLGAVPQYQRLGNIDTVDYYIAQYDAEIRYTDSEVKKILDYVRSNKLYENTIVVITADHGESLGENNYYFEHGMLVNEGSIHIPFLMSTPSVKESLVVDSLVQNIDFAPTILHEFDLSFSGKIDGKSFSPLYSRVNEEVKGRDFIYSATSGIYKQFHETIRTVADKLIRTNEKIFTYYNLVSDPEETENIINTIDPELLAAKKEKFKKFGRNVIAPKPARVDIPKNVTIELKSLGYTN